MMAGWICSFVSCQKQKKKSTSLAPRSPNKLWVKGQPQLAVAWTEVPVPFV